MVLMVPLVVSLIAIAVIAVEVTVIVVVPLMLGDLVEVAVMVVDPTAFAVANPLALIVAMSVLEDVQLAVTVAVLPSSFTPVAVNCCVLPTTTLGLLGLTLIEVSTGLVKNPWHESKNSTTGITATMHHGRKRLNNMQFLVYT